MQSAIYQAGANPTFHDPCLQSAVSTQVSQQRSRPSPPFPLLEFRLPAPSHPARPMHLGTNPPPTAVVRLPWRSPKAKFPPPFYGFYQLEAQKTRISLFCFFKKNICWFIVTSNRNANSSLAVGDIWTEWRHLGGISGLFHIPYAVS